MENKITVAVYIPDEDAKKFLLFQQYYDPFCILLESKFFEQKKATLAVSFDHNGLLQTIQRADFLYSRRYENSYPQL